MAWWTDSEQTFFSGELTDMAAYHAFLYLPTYLPPLPPWCCFQHALYLQDTALFAILFVCVDRHVAPTTPTTYIFGTLYSFPTAASDGRALGQPGMW